MSSVFRILAFASIFVALLAGPAQAQSAEEGKRQSASDSSWVLPELIIEDSPVPCMNGRGSWEWRRSSIQRSRLRPIHDLLHGQAGMQLRQSGHTGRVGLSVRGQSAVATTIELDGVRLANPATGTWDLSLIPDALIQRVELDTGASGGPGPGGTLRLDTGSEDGLQIRGGFGSWERRQADLVWAGSSGQRHDWVVAASTGQEQGDFPYNHPALLGHPERRRSDADRDSQFLYAAWKSDARFRWTASVLHMDSHRGIPPLSNADAPGGWQGDAVWLASIQAERKRSKYAAAMHTVLTNASLDYRTPAGVLHATDTQTISTELNVSRSLGSAFVRLRHHAALSEVRNTFSARVADLNSSATILFDRGALITLSLDMGQRWNQGQAPERPILVPAASVLMWSGQPIWMELGARQTFREPTINELFWVPGGNPQLEHEAGAEVQAGLGARTYRPARRVERLSVQLTAFHGWLKNRIAWRPRFQGAAMQVWSPYNLGRSLNRGVEVLGHASWRSGRAVTGSWSWVRIVDRSNRNAASWNRPLPYVAPHTARVEMTQPMGRWTALVGMVAEARRPTAPDGHQWLPSWTRVDVNTQTTRRISGTPVDVRFAVLNVLDNRRESSRFMPLPGRHVELTARLHFRRE
ncbi:MAG: TonB-dependent receptor plug domain-containing protein [Bacteroidota bacterium]|nr:TonB-dependent receptor plug domain-containing protein [Bacteroidota bacterium]